MTRLPPELRARIVTADGSAPEEPRLNYRDLQRRAALHRMTLERGSPARGHGMKTGYILWRGGTWRRYANLEAAEAAIGAQGAAETVEEASA